MAGDVPVWPDNMALMTVKGGCLHHRYNSEIEFLKGIDKYIAFYNENRPHSSLHYKTPNNDEKD